MAASGGHLNICKMIMDATEDKNPQVGEGGVTPLHLAVIWGTQYSRQNQEDFEERKKVVQLILENIKEKNPADGDGFTPLHVAAEAHGKQTEIVELILKDVTNKSPACYVEGSTPLHLAAGKGSVQMCKIIAQTLPLGHRNPRDFEGQTPCDYAIRSHRHGDITLDSLDQIKALWTTIMNNNSF